MSNARKSAVYAHFTEEEQHFQCDIETNGKRCGAKFAKNKSDGSSSGNLKRHLKRAHPDQHDDVRAKDEAIKKPTLDKAQTSMTSFLPVTTKPASISLTKHDLENGILQMVAYDGVPLTFFSNPGFQTIAGTAAKKLGIKLGRYAVRALVINRAKEEKEKLIEELKGNFFTLKFDGATRLRTHFLGITVQFFGKDGLMVRKKCVTSGRKTQDQWTDKCFIRQNQDVLRHQIIHFPTSSRVSEQEIE